MHPGATKDLKKLDPKIRDKAEETIDNLLNDDPLTLSQTHPMYGQMKGWNTTKVSRGHRVIHQPTGEDDGGIHIGYVGLHEYGDAIQRLTALEPQQTYSTAFTAPGFWHNYANPDEPKTATLHDISAPSWQSWGNSDEEREAAQVKNDQEQKDFESKVKQEAGLPDDTPRYEVHSHWEHGITHALTMGHINIDQAEERGYHNDGREHGDVTTDYYGRNKTRKGGWRPLPKYVHHVSTDADAVSYQGLKTRSELGQRRGAGLGGGSDHTVSVTSDASLAPDIYHALHEHHAAATGKISPQQLMHYAEHPPEGVKPFDWELRAIHNPENLDKLMRGVRDNHHYGDDAPGQMKRSDAAKKFPDWSPVEISRIGGDESDDPHYTHYERPMTKDEHTNERSQFYKTFSTARQHAGGHRDPLFISNDPVAFAKADPKHFGILHLRSQKGAQGYPLRPSEEHHEGADSGEWRLGSGSPFDLMSIERPTPRHLSEFGGDQHTAAKQEEIPPDPGTAPIPEGHVRLWHYTPLWNKDSVKEHGLLASKAHGDAGTGPDEPSSGVWASTRAPDDFKNALHVEFHAPLSDISQRAEDPWREVSGLDEPGSFGKGYHHVIMKGDVKPEQIIALHEPWHATARYMRDSGDLDEYGEMLSKYKEPTGHQDVDDALKAYHYLKGQQGKTAAVRQVTLQDGEQHTGVMVALVPPASIIENLHLEEGEPPEEMHITMAYLGNVDEYSEALLGNLTEVVTAWAEGQAKFAATVQGVGTFLPAEEDGQHVLWASIGAAGIVRLQASLVDYLKVHGYAPRTNHGFTAHLTLAYGNTHFRFMPKVKREDFTVDEIWVVIAGRWESISLSGDTKINPG